VKQAVRRVQLGKLRILVENTAGMGTAVGSRLEEVASIVRGLSSLGAGACLDTAHLFAAGYDISTKAASKRQFRRLSKPLAWKMFTCGT